MPQICLGHKALWQNEVTQHRLLNAVKRSYECQHAWKVGNGPMLGPIWLNGSHLRDDHVINNLFRVFFPPPDAKPISRQAWFLFNQFANAVTISGQGATLTEYLREHRGI